MDRRAAGQPLPALDADVDEDRIELNHSSTTTRLLRRNKGCPGATEGVENQATTIRTVADRISNHGHWFDRRVQGEFAFGATVQSILARIVPDIAPMPAVAPEGDIVD